jgi:uncharacterized protein (TIGR03437 family)
MRLLRFIIFFLGAGLGATPLVVGVYNAASWLPPNLPNSGVAQGSMFTVTGTGLGPATIQHANSYPLPTTDGLGGTTIKVEVGGVIENCIMIYSVSTQVAAILPSTTPVGTGTLTLTYQGENSSFSIKVVGANFGTFALNEDGTGPGVITNGSNAPITYTNPAHAGDELVLWGSGLGPITTGDDVAPPQVDLGTGVQVLVGNKPATVVYGGRGSSAGIDQVNFVVPSGVTGCKTSVVVILKGVTGNVTSMAVAPAGQPTCGDTYNALTAANLQKAVASGTLNIAGVLLSHVPDQGDFLTAAFTSFPVDSLDRSAGGTFDPSIGNCLAYEVEGTSLSTALSDPVKPTFLATGPLMLTGPNGGKTIDAISPGTYAQTLAASSPFYLAPGNYTVANGTGGANVAGFTWDLTLPASVVPNIPASIDPSQDLTLTWTGGSAFGVVNIYAYNGVRATGAEISFVDIICSAEGSAGTFTIPSALLSLLPADGFGTPTSPGVYIQVGGVAVSHYTVAGSPGLDEGFFTAYIGTGQVARIQ